MSPPFCGLRVVVGVESPRCVYEWREQAEAAMRAKKLPAMTQEEAGILAPFLSLLFMFANFIFFFK